MDVKSSSLLVASNGDIKWKPTFRLNAFCDLEVADWPRDTYDCLMDIGINPMSISDGAGVFVNMAPEEHWEARTFSSRKYNLTEIT